MEYVRALVGVAWIQEDLVDQLGHPPGQREGGVTLGGRHPTSRENWARVCARSSPLPVVGVVLI